LEDFEREGREWVRIVFRDYGPGIRPEHKTRIFEEFFSYRPGQKAGTGLGLAFVRRAVAAHGGNVSENGVYGEGAKFFVEFPRSAEEVSHG
jgi:two-component system sensor histidine kinase GlrK